MSYILVKCGMQYNKSSPKYEDQLVVSAYCLEWSHVSCEDIPIKLFDSKYDNNNANNNNNNKNNNNNICISISISINGRRINYKYIIATNNLMCYHDLTAIL